MGCFHLTTGNRHLREASWWWTQSTANPSLLRVPAHRERATVMLALIVTPKLDDIDPQAWLTGVLAGSADHRASKRDDLLTWNWKAKHQPDGAA